MANDEDLARLRQGVAAWNDWWTQNWQSRVDLSEADLAEVDLTGANLRGAYLAEANLSGANLSGANLSGANLENASLHGANLEKANLHGANLRGANLRGANLHGANLHGAYLSGADLSEAVPLKVAYSADLTLTGTEGALPGADLSEADLSEAELARVDLTGANLEKANLRGAYLAEANLHRAKLAGADLRGANLQSAILVWTNLTNADLTGCWICGISAWGVKLEGAKQRDLLITTGSEPEITVDNIEVAQFIYLLLHNEKLRDVIDTITSKVVLILGRFTPERKAVLDALRDELRKHDYLPVLFDFEKPTSRDITETVSLLAGMARFVVADITEARSIPQELMVIAPGLPSVPIQPLLQEGAGEYGMFEHFRRYPWVLKEHVYASPQRLIADLSELVISPAEAKVRELRG